MEQIEFGFIDDQPPLCACGCGQPVDQDKERPYGWNIYLNYHASSDPKNKAMQSKNMISLWDGTEYRTKQDELHADPDYRKNQSEKGKIVWEDPSHKNRMKDIHKVRCNTPEFKALMSIQFTEMWKRPEIQEIMKERDQKRCNDPEYLANAKLKALEQWSNPALVADARQRGIEQWADPEARKRQSERSIVMWQDPEFHASMVQKHKDSWQDPIIAARMLNGLGKSPNRFETDFDNVTPDILCFTGDGSWWRRLTVRLSNGEYISKNKNPDFKVTNQRKVIELYGDYFHAGEFAEDIILAYHSIHIQCMVIWQSEWKANRDEILEKVNEFING